MLTSNGVCYTYNSKSPTELFKASTQRKLFEKVYNVEQESNVQKAKGDGDRFGLTFYLDANTRMRPQTELGTLIGFRYRLNSHRVRPNNSPVFTRSTVEPQTLTTAPL